MNITRALLLCSLAAISTVALAQQGPPPIGPIPGGSGTVGGGPFTSGNVVTGNGGSTIHW